MTVTGRPLVEGVRRAERLHVRLTEREMKFVRRIAKGYNVTPSQWVRVVLRRAILADQVEHINRREESDGAKVGAS